MQRLKMPWGLLSQLGGLGILLGCAAAEAALPGRNAHAQLTSGPIGLLSGLRDLTQHRGSGKQLVVGELWDLAMRLKAYLEGVLQPKQLCQAAALMPSWLPMSWPGVAKYAAGTSVPATRQRLNGSISLDHQLGWGLVQSPSADNLCAMMCWTSRPAHCDCDQPPVLRNAL